MDKDESVQELITLFLTKQLLRRSGVSFKQGPQLKVSPVSQMHKDGCSGKQCARNSVSKWSVQKKTFLEAVTSKIGHVLSSRNTNSSHSVSPLSPLGAEGWGRFLCGVKS